MQWREIAPGARRKRFWSVTATTFVAGGVLVGALYALARTAKEIAGWIRDEKAPLEGYAAQFCSWWDGLAWQTWAIAGLSALVVCNALVAGYRVWRADERAKQVAETAPVLHADPIHEAVTSLRESLVRHGVTGQESDAAELLYELSEPLALGLFESGIAKRISEKLKEKTLPAEAIRRIIAAWIIAGAIGPPKDVDMDPYTLTPEGAKMVLRVARQRMERKRVAAASRKPDA